jgi:hypothetical protein
MESPTLEAAARSFSDLEKELLSIRQQSLIAMRKGDYRAVAKYTNEAARVNRLITEMDFSWGRPQARTASGRLHQSGLNG